MSTSKSYFIEILDNGFVMKEGSSKRAVETSERVEEIILTSLKNAMSAIGKPETSNVVVNISVDVNVPQILPR